MPWGIACLFIFLYYGSEPVPDTAPVCADPHLVHIALATGHDLTRRHAAKRARALAAEKLSWKRLLRSTVLLRPVACKPRFCILLDAEAGFRVPSCPLGLRSAFYTA